MAIYTIASYECAIIKPSLSIEYLSCVIISGQIIIKVHYEFHMKSFSLSQYKMQFYC